MPTPIQRAKKILKLNAEIKKLYKRLDFQEAALLKEFHYKIDGGELSCDGKIQIDLINNFASNNVCWRPAKFRRLQIRIFNMLTGKKLY